MSINSAPSASFNLPTSNIGSWFYELKITTKNNEVISYKYGQISVKGSTNPTNPCTSLYSFNTIPD